MKIYKNQIGDNISKAIPKSGSFTTAITTIIGRIYSYMSGTAFEKEESVNQPEEEQSSLNYYRVVVKSADDLSWISYLVQRGYVVFANVELLTTMDRDFFLKKLARLLMEQGTHYDKMSDKWIVCASRGTVEVMSNQKETAEVYHLEDYRRMKEEPYPQIPRLEPITKDAIYGLSVHCVEDIESIEHLLEAGYVVLANYQRLKGEDKYFFEADLKEMITANGFLLESVGKGVIICGQEGMMVHREPERPKVYHIGTKKED